MDIGKKMEDEFNRQLEQHEGVKRLSQTEEGRRRLREGGIGTTGKQIDPRGVQVAAHYNLHPSGIEAIEVFAHLNANLGSAFKYVFRLGEKVEGDKKQSMLKDIDKALYYVEADNNYQGMHTGEEIGAHNKLYAIADCEPNVWKARFYETLANMCVTNFPTLVQRKMLSKCLRRLREEVDKE